MSHKNKLEFLRIINSQKLESKKEVGIRLDGLSRGLLANPRASYAFGDITNILEDAKKEMNTLNDRIFDGFSCIEREVAKNRLEGVIRYCRDCGKFNSSAS